MTLLTKQSSGVHGGVYEINNLSSQSTTFNASFDMVKTDGNSSYSHNIYDSHMKVLLSPGASGNSTLLNRITIVSMREGPVVNVPTNITLLGYILVKIWLNLKTVNDHFGELPIYGTQT